MQENTSGSATAEPELDIASSNVGGSSLDMNDIKQGIPHTAEEHLSPLDDTNSDDSKLVIDVSEEDDELINSNDGKFTIQCAVPEEDSSPYSTWPPKDTEATPTLIEARDEAATPSDIQVLRSKGIKRKMETSSEQQQPTTSSSSALNFFNTALDCSLYRSKISKVPHPGGTTTGVSPRGNRDVLPLMNSGPLPSMGRAPLLATPVAPPTNAYGYGLPMPQSPFNCVNEGLNPPMGNMPPMNYGVPFYNQEPTGTYLAQTPITGQPSISAMNMNTPGNYLGTLSSSIPTNYFVGRNEVYSAKISNDLVPVMHVVDRTDILSYGMMAV
ncbi:unnamed protein product [Strongylus vulgaris]|uniref:Uncharacterized protein n=1 Tax=Strongylus vulgaris TaxID=40348 RepID=A0A3P7JI04_STRVU|nr:unnamed protein product [Strongylus vulgaris]